MRNTVVMVVLAILAAATWVATWQREDRARRRNAARTRRRSATTFAARASRHRRARPRDVPRPRRAPRRAARRGAAAAHGRQRRIPARGRYGVVDLRDERERAKDGSLLDLVGNVEVRNAPTDGSAPQTILTQALRFWPDTSSVESDQPVEIRVGDWQLHAVGLRTDLKGDTLELESQVHGTFAPRSSCVCALALASALAAGAQQAGNDDEELQCSSPDRSSFDGQTNMMRAQGAADHARRSAHRGRRRARHRLRVRRGGRISPHGQRAHRGRHRRHGGRVGRVHVRSRDAVARRARRRAGVVQRRRTERPKKRHGHRQQDVVRQRRAHAAHDRRRVGAARQTRSSRAAISSTTSRRARVVRSGRLRKPL